MPEMTGLKETVEDVLVSYEARIESLSSMFEASQSLIGNLPKSLLDDEQGKEKINTQLKDLLAKNSNLRKKDFDKMMHSVLSFQEERGEEVKGLVKKYLGEERNVALGLRKTLIEVKDALATGEIQKIKGVQLALKTLFAKQEKRKGEIVSRLKEFQSEQGEIPRRLTELLAKGEDLRIKDFKSMLDNIKTQRTERLSLQKKRMEEVAKMIKDFRAQRQKLAFPTKAIYPVRNSVDADKK